MSDSRYMNVCCNTCGKGVYNPTTGKAFCNHVRRFVDPAFRCTEWENPEKIKIELTYEELTALAGALSSDEVKHGYNTPLSEAMWKVINRFWIEYRKRSEEDKKDG